MFSDLKPYTDYSSSGIKWVPTLPTGWQRRRGKALFRKMDRPVRGDDQIVTCFRDGVVTLRANRRTHGFTEALREIGYQGVRRGDLVIHAMDSFAGAVGVSDSDGKVTPVYSVCAPRADADPGYYGLVVREMASRGWILSLARGVRERSTDFRFEAFGAQFLPTPSLSEQEAIVKFLGHATARIDRAIATKRKMATLLSEQKRVLVNRVLTFGLELARELKDSGISWIGDIPEHWEVRRVKDLCVSIVDCKNRTPEFKESGQYTVVRTSCVKDGKFKTEGSYLTDEANFRTWTARGAPREGDVFFTREAPTGEACLAPDRDDLCMGQRMMYFRPDPRQLDPQYLLYSIYGPVGRAYIDISRNGSTVGHLRLGQVCTFPLLWCPIEEQQQIVRYVADVGAPVKTVSERTVREIELLREFRTRLTSDVVTGQLDVRGAAAKLPDLDPADLAAADVDDSDDLDAVAEEFLDEAEHQ